MIASPIRARKYVAIREKWAAALSMLLPQELRDELRERRAPAKTIISMFDQDHVVLHALGGEDRWWNFTPLLRPAHREKSRNDTKIVAKVKRIARVNEDFQRRVLAVEKKPSEKRSRWPKRSFQRRQS